MKQTWVKSVLVLCSTLVVLAAGYFWASLTFGTHTYQRETAHTTDTALAAQSVDEPEEAVLATWPGRVDTADYDKRLLALAKYIPPAPVTTTSTSTGENGVVSTKTTTSEPTSPLQYAADTNVTVSGKKWPPAAPYPNAGAILPFKRILAFYGNFYSVRMGILGEYPRDEVIAKLLAVKKEWEAADPSTPVVPAIEYIAMVAQAEAGRDGMYRAAMPDEHMEKAIDMAREIDGIMIFDLQVGLSTIQKELLAYDEYLKLPDVHLALDPEFTMKNGNRPGTVIGSYDAVDINWTIDHLSKIVRENQIPPKVLIIHRFTYGMVTNVAAIKPTPEVQVIMVMDGWGPKELKRGTYNSIVAPEPVQFTGLKIFYKNDLKPPSTGLLTPADVLNLNPSPIYIQYQ